MHAPPMTHTDFLPPYPVSRICAHLLPVCSVLRPFSLPHCSISISYPYPHPYHAPMSFPYPSPSIPAARPPCSACSRRSTYYLPISLYLLITPFSLSLDRDRVCSLPFLSWLIVYTYHTYPTRVPAQYDFLCLLCWPGACRGRL
ncbi:hypothetical protein BC834DRAFT_900252, partial [Gloeopeniophorella convolvens]